MTSVEQTFRHFGGLKSDSFRVVQSSTPG